MALDQAQCSVCLTGHASVLWNGGTGSFHVDHVVNKTTLTTGSLRLQAILQSTLPTWGQSIYAIGLSDIYTLYPLAAGYEYPDVNSGTLNFHGSSIAPGTYYLLLYLTEFVSGSWFYDDWIVMSRQVICDGHGCATLVPSCSEDATTMCLVGGRYRVTSTWKNQYAGGRVSGLNKTRLTAATGAFWLLDSNAYEYFVRINTATDNGRAWITITTFTDVEFFVTVEDLFGGQSKTYRNPPYSSALIYDPFFFVYP